MPQSNQLPIGGLSGGLYHAFNAVGLAFFVFLIGSSRAGHPRLKSNRVCAGGFLILGLTSAIIFSYLLPSAQPKLFTGVAGFVAGGLVGLFVAMILLLYVSSVEGAIGREERWKALFNEKHSELLKRKVAPTEAHDQATTYANQKTSGCFIATAAYGSSAAYEVTLLRWWRDEVLLPTRHGRAFVDLYYKISPKIAALIGPHQVARSAVRLLLSPVVIWVSRLERSKRDMVTQ